MGKKGLEPTQRQGPAQKSAGRDDFPETRAEVLAEAAVGNWGRFLEQYLRPCWREVICACRSHQVPLADADDLYQELMLRLIRHAGFSQEVRRALARKGQEADFCGNLPARYLRYRQSPLASARFRNYLKRVIQNLVIEAVRKSRRRPRQFTDPEWEAFQPRLEQSISTWLDRQWLEATLHQASVEFCCQCASATTRAKRRLFHILYLAEVEGRSTAAIGREYGIDRTTASGLLREARVGLLSVVQQNTHLASADLKALLAGHVDELRRALAAAFAAFSPVRPPNTERTGCCETYYPKSPGAGRARIQP